MAPKKTREAIVRVTLVVPPSPFLADARVMASLGILWGAAALRQAGHDVVVLDLEGNAHWLEEVHSHVRTQRPEAVGVTGTSAHFPFCLQIAKAVKEEAPNVRTILGGAHATMGPQLCVGKGFDVVVMDDGLTGALLALEPNAVDNVEEIPTKSGPVQLKGVVRGPMVPTEAWPLPARDLHPDYTSYKYYISGDPEKLSTIVMWTMGCPMGCLFCGGRELEFYRRYRARPVAQCMDELDLLHERYGYRFVQAMDDEVNIKKAWLFEFCDAMAKRDVKFGWRAFVKAELFTDDVALAMAKAGCLEVCSGVESGSDYILKNWVRKNTTYDLNLRAVKTAQKYGIKFKSFTIIGHPGETREDIMLTKKWLLEARPDAFDLCVFTPYPGSPIFNQLFPQNGRSQLPSPRMGGVPIDAPMPDFDRESWFYKGVGGEYKSSTRTLGHDGQPGVEPEELVALRDEIDAEVKSALKQDGVTRVSPLFEAQQIYEAGMGQTPIHKLKSLPVVSL